MQPSTGHKFQVMSSAEKVTNAILSCFGWMEEHAKKFIKRRTTSMEEDTKLEFFNHLHSLATSESRYMDRLILSERASEKLTGDKFRSCDDSIRRMAAYIILIGLNKNCNYVKAIAANYRQVASSRKTVSHCLVVLHTYDTTRVVP